LSSLSNRALHSDSFPIEGHRPVSGATE
jgi:hypothetical protein